MPLFPHIQTDWVSPSKRGGMAGFPRADRAAPRDFPRANPLGNPALRKSLGAACQPKENPVHPDSFTWIYILFKILHFDDYSDFFYIDV